MHFTAVWKLCLVISKLVFSLLEGLACGGGQVIPPVFKHKVKNIPRRLVGLVKGPHRQIMKIPVACLPGKIIVTVRQIFFHRQEIIGNIPIIKLRPFDLRHTGGRVFNYSLLLCLLLALLLSLLINSSSPPFFLSLTAVATTLHLRLRLTIAIPHFISLYLSLRLSYIYRFSFLHQGLLRVDRIQKTLVMLLVHTPNLLARAAPPGLDRSPPTGGIFHRQRFPGKRVF